MKAVNLKAAFKSVGRGRLIQFPAFYDLMFEARMDDCSQLRKLFECLKDVVKNINMDINPRGMFVQAMDSSHVAIVSFQLREKAFAYFSCPKPITIGLDIENVLKILKIAGSDDFLTLEYDNESGSSNTLKFKFESKRSGEKVTEFALELIVFDSENLGIPETQFEAIVTVPSVEFNRICREMNTFADTIRIQVDKETIKFSIKGEIGTGKTVMREKRNEGGDDEVILDVSTPVSQSYSSRYLGLFSKPTFLSGKVSLHLSRGTPLMIEYTMANEGGELKYYLAPKFIDEKEEDM